MNKVFSNNFLLTDNLAQILSSRPAKGSSLNVGNTLRFYSLDEKKRKKVKLTKKEQDALDWANKEGKPFYKLHSDTSRLYEVVLPRCILWLSKAYIPNGIINLFLYKDLLSSIALVFKSRGDSEGILWIKDVRSAFLNYLSGNKVKLSISLDKNGLPSVIPKPIRRQIIDRSPHFMWHIRLVMTILFASRSLRLGKVPSIDPITAPFKGCTVKYNQLIEDMENFTKSFWTDYGFRGSLLNVPRSARFKKFHFSTKMGPNGHATLTSLTDLWYLSYKEILYDAICTIGGEKLVEATNYLLSNWFPIEWCLSTLLSTKTSLKRDVPILSKISFFADRETKVRVIAIGDYWTQTCLKPLHDYLYKFLKMIPQDRTYNQGSLAQLHRTDGIEDYFSSADLTAATDRFPIHLIAKVLEGRFPKYYVNAWKTLMVDRDFWILDPKLQNSLNLESVRWAVGNPLGFYSSWATFAISHHFVIYYCCKKLSIDPKMARYLLLGDDIVINDRVLRDLYYNVMETLGVEISKPKSHDSPFFFEFAKRYYFLGTEISPFPISALQETIRDNSLVTNLLLEVRDKGWNTCEVSDSLDLFYSYVLKFPSSLRAKKVLQGRVVGAVLLWVQGKLNPVDVVKTFKEVYRLPDIVGQDAVKQYLSAFANCVFDAYLSVHNKFEQADSFKGKHLPFGWTAKRISYLMSNLPILGSRLSENLPIPWWTCPLTILINKLPVVSTYNSFIESFRQFKVEVGEELLDDPDFNKILNYREGLNPFRVRMYDRLFDCQTEFSIIPDLEELENFSGIFQEFQPSLRWLLKSVIIPPDDRVYSERSKFMVARGAKVFSDKLHDYFTGGPRWVTGDPL